MRAGRTFVSESPAGPQLYLDRADRGVRVSVLGGAGATVVVLGDQGSIGAAAVHSADWSAGVVVPRVTAYVRAQLLGSNGELRALTSPIWWPPAD
jgi:hypothetical protein